MRNSDAVSWDVSFGLSFQFCGAPDRLLPPSVRTSTEMPDEQAETGFLDGASLAHRFSDNEWGQGELDSPEIRRSMVDRSVGVQCETVELKTVGAQTDENEDACARPGMMAPLRLSTEIPDEAAWRTLTPTTGATAAERRVFDGAGTIHQKVAHQAAKGRFGRARRCSHITRTAHWRLSASALLWGMKLVTMKTWQ